MRVLIINPPHQSIGSRMPREMLPPLGLLAVGGTLIDDGHDVALIDGDIDDMALAKIVHRAEEHKPDAILVGHNGSTSAHPTIVELASLLRAALPDVWIVYGGVFPTYHWREALADAHAIDVIVRGEGEETTRQLMRAIEAGTKLGEIAGIAFRDADDRNVSTAPAPMIARLDNYRVAWELVELSRYSYYGGKRGVVIQLSRGCPHLCSFCGQRGFWTRWRHRDPVRLAKEIAWLNREHGVEMISLADENPTTSKRVWRAFLEALIAERCSLTIIATIRADDIVRDADILHLYRQAGFERILIGMEHTNGATLEAVRKGSATRTDREAIALLRRAGILSLTSFIVGFAEETDADYWRALRQLIAYDPDQLIALYVTPHRWTPFFRTARERRVIQLDRRRWDYRHQVLAGRMPAWRTFLWVKTIEALVQARPKALWRTWLHPDPCVRHSMQWYSRIGRRVWLHELASFIMRDRRERHGPTLEQFWGDPQDADEGALRIVRGDANRATALGR